jgi:hypothetical protein
MNIVLPVIIRVPRGTSHLPTMKIYEEEVHPIQIAQFHKSLQILENQEVREIMGNQLSIM